ncbi:hypothetical protein [Fuchsiella alkaliacetigena]|uniref:hypothetical protein n=1 Tax=Fuchsiella alkaliacetigena TaxID=957042 RepID=UPI00200A9A43|nr:hypothetical protein [Fuchsiella alkaliacetigena]MCK8825360.1 hypothetical protein [Fuchsiella alkaliacetigena]
MYTQEKFAEFLEEYRQKIARTDNLLEESEYSYRVKKLAVFYGLKDQETFNSFLQDEKGRELLKLAKYILINVKEHPFYSSKGVNQTADALLRKYFTNIHLTPLKDDMTEGYYKLFTDYIRKKNKDKLEKEIKDLEIDINTLEFTSSV